MFHIFYLFEENPPPKAIWHLVVDILF